MSSLFVDNNVTIKTLTSPSQLSTDSGTLLRGTLNFNREALKAIHPAYTGYTHIFVLDSPLFLSKIANPAFAAEAKIHESNFRFLLEHSSLSYSGSPDLQLNTSDVNTGWSDRTIGVPTTASYDSNQFTISMIESYGEPLRRCMEFIINGMTDAEAKYTHMYGANCEPTLENITSNFMIVTTDQTLKNITDITVWNAVFPTGIDRDNLNWEQGNVDIIQAKTVTFRGVIKPNAYAYKAKAQELLAQRFQFYKSIRDAEIPELLAGAGK